VPFEKELEVALIAAKRAAALALEYQPGITADAKADLSPVTRADRESEKLITDMLLAAFPEDGLLGEEGADVPSRNGRRWIVDPIDGTRDYLRGNPLWANLIALEEHGEIVAGLVHLPCLSAIYTGVKGGGAFRNGKPIRVSTKTEIHESVLCLSSYGKPERRRFKPHLLDWMSEFWAVRGLGGAPDAMMVASGQAEVWLEPKAAAWDLAPLKVIAEEAGARFFNFDGGNSIFGGNCVICVPALEEDVKRLLEPR
jgi:histidinol phosphatase-like enzyme (inositol monophosphatase family)